MGECDPLVDAENCCDQCAPGTFAASDGHDCLDCSPIFACSSKEGMFLDEQPSEPPQADFMMMPFNTAGCANTGGEITTEQQCQAACEYLEMDYATDGTNIVETGPSTCFSQQGNFCKFALGPDPSPAMDTLA